jgi:hypothetical protein
MLIDFQQSTQHYTPEDRTIHKSIQFISNSVQKLNVTNRSLERAGMTLISTKQFDTLRCEVANRKNEIQIKLSYLSVDITYAARINKICCKLGINGLPENFEYKISSA